MPEVGVLRWSRTSEATASGANQDIMLCLEVDGAVNSLGPFTVSECVYDAGSQCIHKTRTSGIDPLLPGARDLTPFQNPSMASPN